MIIRGILKTIIWVLTKFYYIQFYSLVPWWLRSNADLAVFSFRRIHRLEEPTTSLFIFEIIQKYMIQTLQKLYPKYLLRQDQWLTYKIAIRSNECFKLENSFSVEFIIVKARFKCFFEICTEYEECFLLLINMFIYVIYARKQITEYIFW